MPATSLDRHTVVVIGGSAGIGFAVAEAAAAEGAQVIIGSSHEDKVADAVRRLPGGSRGLTVDVTSETSVERFFETIGALDHLVFTAGDWNTSPVGTPLEVELDRVHSALEVRLFGAIRAVKHGARKLSENGSITLTSGALAHHPFKGMWSGSLVVGSVNSLVVGLAAELAPIRVNAVSPGFIDTSLAADIHSRIGPILQRMPLKRSGEADEAAMAYLYAMKGRYTTGQQIRVDGGYSVA